MFEELESAMFEDKNCELTNLGNCDLVFEINFVASWKLEPWWGNHVRTHENTAGAMIDLNVE